MNYPYVNCIYTYIQYKPHTPHTTQQTHTLHFHTPVSTSMSGPGFHISHIRVIKNPPTNLEVNILFKDESENILHASIKKGQQEFVLGSIYGPRQHDDINYILAHVSYTDF